jgi:hypothetical protein
MWCAHRLWDQHKQERICRLHSITQRCLARFTRRPELVELIPELEEVRRDIEALQTLEAQRSVLEAQRSVWPLVETEAVEKDARMKVETHNFVAG